MQIVLAPLSGTVKLFYTALWLEKGIKANVNMMYSLTQRCKAAQLCRGFRSLEENLDLTFVNGDLVIGFGEYFCPKVQEGIGYPWLHDTLLQKVSQMCQVPFKAKWPKKCVELPNSDWLIYYMAGWQTYILHNWITPSATRLPGLSNSCCPFTEMTKSVKWLRAEDCVLQMGG